jgi:hypothetical protein
MLRCLFSFAKNLYCTAYILLTCKHNIRYYVRDGAESQRAECKGAKCQGAEPNVPNCQIVDVIKCATYWAALFSDNYTLRGVFRLGAHF